MKTIELNETNYCDQKPVVMEFTFEEHDLMNDILMNAVESMDFALKDIIVQYDLPKDSEIRTRYEKIEELKERFFSLWSDRFNNAPYEN